MTPEMQYWLNGLGCFGMGAGLTMLYFNHLFAKSRRVTDEIMRLNAHLMQENIELRFGKDHFSPEEADRIRQGVLNKVL